MSSIKAADGPSRAVGEKDPREGPRAGRGFGDRVLEYTAEYGIVIFLVLMCVGFAIWQSGTFPTSRNIKSLLGNQAIPAILALAVVLPLAAGEFDLSIAANLGFCSIASAEFASHGMTPALVIILTLMIGAAIGLINAVIVVGIGVNAFIATLGMSTVLAGGNLLLTNGNTVFEGIGESFTSIATTRIFGIEIVVLYFLIVAIVAWYAMERTPFGRYLRATGMAREAARLSGISTTRRLSGAFVIAGTLSGLCGVLQTAHLGSAAATVGPEFLLPAYAAAFLGATTIRRGMFNVWGTVVGVLVLAVGINGLTLAGAPIWVPDVFNGVALIVAVSAAVLVARHRERAKPKTT
ncbi:MAG: ABC transporter permease [Actinobacteria bacterium]|nr:ABC transporter permease [Actinomycetota bacterium]